VARRRSPAEALRHYPLDLVVCPDIDGREWTLREPFVWDKAGDRIEAPAGTRTDFASTPRCLWWLYSPTGRWGRAAVLHDFMYRTGLRSRAEADAIFLEGMRVLGVPWHRRMVLYLAVRLFGGGSWRGRG
jgi:hypothetical protein